MIEDLIIIIPTHNRQHYLGRVVKYYSSFPCKVYICDSSKQKANVDTTENISYRWVPQSNFYSKVLDVINVTSVDYYALSPDDDFLKIETLLECYHELKNNDKYSFGIGKQVLFNEGLSEGFFVTNSLNRMMNINNVAFDSKEKYIEYFWEHYQNILWSIYRKSVIKSAFESLLRCNFKNGNFIEVTLGIEGLRRGVAYVSQKGLNFRERIEREHWGNTTLSITSENIEKDRNLQKDMEIFLNYHSADGGFASYCLNCYLNRTRVYRKTLLSKLKGCLPTKLKQIIKKAVSKSNAEHNKIMYEDCEMLMRVKESIIETRVV